MLPCDPALALAPAETMVEPHGLVQLVATGGTGLYRYSLVEDASGAELGESTGAYLAGSTWGVTDRVMVTDEGCTGSAQAAIAVLEPLGVLPLQASVPPGAIVQVEVSGGSGGWDCALPVDASGAAVGTTTQGCNYVAGDGQGTDRLRVTDVVTGVYADVDVDVDGANALRLAGRGLVLLLEGSRWVPAGAGGSGTWSLAVLEGPLEVDGEAVLGAGAGQGRVQVTDRYVPELSVEVPVTVLQGWAPELERDGERSGEGVALGLGDVDGDGHPDAALGFVELSTGGWYSGAVAIYAGTGDGLDAEPARVIEGTDDQQTLGRALAVADLDGDGLAELLVGADRADYGATNNGAVHIYGGVAGAFFSEAPTRTLYGGNAYGRMGSALAACDFDGDGSLDIAAGALDDADQNVASPADKQGAAHVYLGDGGSFGDEPDFVLYGVVPASADDEDADGDGWASQAGMQLGTALAAGDFDGDGLCDLAAGAPEADGEYGVVLIWRGTDVVGEGLERTPAAMLLGTEDSEFGRRLAAGDVDGDGQADLLVGAWRSDEGSSGAGGAWLYLGSSLALDGDTAGVRADDADWRVLGTSTDERMGSAVDLADLDGDGLDEVIVGAYRGEVGTGVNEGVVAVHDGAAIAATAPGHDGTDDEPWIRVEGVDAYDRLGQAVGHLGDVDGDGVGDLLSLAGYDSAHGIETGAPYLLPGRDGATPQLLELPGESAGHGVGLGLALFDTDGDGFEDLLVGAPEAGDAEVGSNAGVLLRYAGEEAGLDDDGQAFLGGHDEHSASDRYGYAAATAGDFDGDGYEDLAVVARKDSRPSSFDAAVTDNPDDCPGTRSQAGAVYVYRGGPGGLAPEPAFAWYGPTEEGYVYGVKGGFDRDGDGYDDLLVGSELWGDGGGFALLYGRPAGSATTVLCEAEQYDGTGEFDKLGSSLAVLGDLDGDGCDEVVVGASGEEADDDYFNQGVIRVLWGTCSGRIELTTMALDIVGSEAGSALDAGRDVDGDGLPDLVVGAAAYRSEFAEIGAAFLVSGAHVLGLQRQEHEPGALPPDDEVLLELLLPRDGLLSRSGVHGDEAGGYFGAAVALVPDPADPARALVAVGSPLAAVGGTDRSGGVQLYRFADEDGDGEDGLDEVPWGILVGDDLSLEGQLGATLLGASVQGVPTLVVGAPASDRVMLDGGAVLVAPLEQR